MGGVTIVTVQLTTVSLLLVLEHNNGEIPLLQLWWRGCLARNGGTPQTTAWWKGTKNHLHVHHPNNLQRIVNLPYSTAIHVMGQKGF